MSQVLSQYIVAVTSFERYERVDRWLARDHLRLDGLTWDGAKLLDERLAIRHRVGRVTFAMLAVVVIGGVAWAIRAGAPIRRVDAGAWGLVAFVALFSTAPWVVSGLIRRAERRLAAELPRRVTGDHAVPTWRRIGPIRLAGGVLLLGTAMVMLLQILHSGVAASLVVLYAVLLAAMVASTVVLVARELMFPTLAVDEATLRVDDRWRSQSAYVALSPLLLLYGAGNFFLPDSPSGPRWLGLLGFALFAIVPVLHAVANIVDRQRLNRPAPTQAYRT